MKNNGKGMIAFGILMLLVAFTAVFLVRNRTENSRKTRVVYIPKVRDDTNDFWTSLLEGAEMAAEENDVELTILAPGAEDDYDGQIRFIDKAISSNPDAILLSPSSMTKIDEAANRIVQADIRLVLVDSELSQNIQSMVVATDNVEAGKKMGQFLAERLKENQEKHPVIGVVAHVQGSSTAEKREEGFREGLGDLADCIVGTVFCDSNYDKAYEVTRELLMEHPDINALVGLNEYSAVGAARAVRDLGLADQISMVGFDSSIEEVSMLEEGLFDAIVVQKPFNMGYLGIEYTVALITGEAVPEMVDSGSELITKENMYTEENQKLLFPFWD